MSPPPPRPKRALIAGAALLTALGLAVTKLPWDFSAIGSADALARSWRRLVEFLAAFGAPDLSGDALRTAFGMMGDTLSTALLGTALGLAAAWPLALGAAHAVVLGQDRHPPVRRWCLRAFVEASRLLLDVLRGVPDFAWALLLANFTGIGTPTGVLAIGISVAGILGKILSEQWDNVDPREYAALRSTGAGRLTTFFYGVQPLSARAMQSFVLMRTECAIRNASVIGVIAGGGLGSGLWDAFKDSRYDFVVTLLAAMLALTATADLGANLLRHHLRADPAHPRRGTPGSARRSTVRRTAGVAACLAALCACAVAQWPAFAHLGAELTRIEPGFAAGFARRLLLSPDPTAIGVAMQESFVPLAVALLTTTAAVCLAGLLSHSASFAFQIAAGRFTGERLAASARPRRWLTLIAARGLGLLWRGVPEVAWLLILGAFFRQGLLAGVLAVTLHSSGVLLRVFVESIDNVPYERLERVTGAGRRQVFLYGAVPTAWPDWRTYAFFQFEVNVRMGIVLGMVGAGGLGEAFDGNVKFDRLERACTFLWAMILRTVVIDRVSRRLQLRRTRW